MAHLSRCWDRVCVNPMWLQFCIIYPHVYWTLIFFLRSWQAPEEPAWWVSETGRETSHVHCVHRCICFLRTPSVCRELCALAWWNACDHDPVPGSETAGIFHPGVHRLGCSCESLHASVSFFYFLYSNYLKHPPVLNFQNLCNLPHLATFLKAVHLRWIFWELPAGSGKQQWLSFLTWLSPLSKITYLGLLFSLFPLDLVPSFYFLKNMEWVVLRHQL